MYLDLVTGGEAIIKNDVVWWLDSNALRSSIPQLEYADRRSNEDATGSQPPRPPSLYSGPRRC